MCVSGRRGGCLALGPEHEEVKFHKAEAARIRQVERERRTRRATVRVRG